ncbi:hypothetical protein PQG02_00420 (plasmid) [Nostoc sp. UHCC 0926]|uniref:hypothetical protein n=1 Tax=Nostoc sp. UHCC 0926 TaxID=3025190 RepID=UPI0023613C59|nr:hypothetical protein [Nostoc sp. UHCC 0926]WDD30198.1 hypothetical protein PQG02_00420 [Nostoc sp. UHCC 0926]
MGEAKRRKKSDPNWGKSEGFKKSDPNLGKSEAFNHPNKPKITYLTESHPDYQTASDIKNAHYAGKSRVYLVRLDYADGEYFVGAVNTFLVGTEITVNAIWTPYPNSQRTGLEILDLIRRDIGLKARDEMFQADAVLIDFESE